MSLLAVMIFMTPRTNSLECGNLSTLPQEVELVSALTLETIKSPIDLPIPSSVPTTDDVISQVPQLPAPQLRKNPVDRRPVKISFEDPDSGLCSVHLGSLFWVMACLGCVALAVAFSHFLSDSKAVCLSLMLSGALSMCLTLSLSLSVCLSVSFSGYFGGMMFGCGFGCMAGWLAGVGYGVCQVGPERWVKEKLNSIMLCIRFVSCTV